MTAIKEPQREIEKLKKDYEDFLYTVSHDFNEPLRHIKSFMTLFLRETKDHEFSDDQHQYLKIIQEKSDKASAMLEALLKLSRLNTNPPVKKITKALDFVKMITHEFDDAMIVQDIKSIDDLNMTIDSQSLLAALSEIVDNAIKFGGNNQPAELTIETVDQHLNISLKDYGIGAKADYLHKIALLFQKLNHSDDFKGLGVGLTFANKIIDLHGGSLTFESVLGEYFTANIKLPC